MSITSNDKSLLATDKESIWYVVGAYASFVAAILLVLGIAAWGVFLDFEDSRKNLLQTEINRLRSHALRTVLRLQDELQTDASNTASPIGRVLADQLLFET